MHTITEGLDPGSRSTEQPSVEALQQRQGELLDPLSLIRPEIYSAIAEESYRTAQCHTPDETESYKFLGSPDYETEGIKSFQQVVSGVLEGSSEVDFSLLDVGAGGGQFVEESLRQHPELRGFSLSASDLRTGSELVSDYRVGDADKLLEIYDPNSMDMIVTNTTTQHIPDNLKLLASMYALLKEGGVLLADELWISTPHNYGFDLVEYLKGRGFHVDGTGGWRINNLVLCKKDDEPRLLLPLDYIEPNPRYYVDNGIAKDEFGHNLTGSSAQVRYKVNR